MQAEVNEKFGRPDFKSVLNKKNKWRDSILSFKTKDAVFRRVDGEWFERSFEPCVAGRIYHYPHMVEGKPHLVFQTDRGMWFVPCKSPKHLKRMVSPFKPDQDGYCPNLIRKFRKSMKEHGGSFYDEITGLPPGTPANTNANTYTTPDQPDVIQLGMKRYGAFDVDWDDPYWDEPTPWEVSCA